MCRHAEVAASAEVRAAIPALAELAGWIGDPMVRNMGTLGGSIANADPAACYPAAVLALGATVHTDRRDIAGEDFFTGIFETALEAGRTDHRRQLSAAAARRLLQAQAAGVALPARRCLRLPARRRRAGRGHRRQGERLPRRRDRAGARAQLHARGSQGGGDRAADGINADLHALGRIPRGDDQRAAARAVAAALGALNAAGPDGRSGRAVATVAGVGRCGDRRCSRASTMSATAGWRWRCS